MGNSKFLLKGTLLQIIWDKIEFSPIPLYSYLILLIDSLINQMNILMSPRTVVGTLAKAAELQFSYIFFIAVKTTFLTPFVREYLITLC